MTKKFLIIIYGPTGAGKTTVGNLIESKFPSVFSVSFDKVKKLISDYSSGTYPDRSGIDRILSSTASQAIKENFSILLEGDVKLMQDSSYYKNLAEEHNLNLIQVNIDCPLEVCYERALQRAQLFKERGIKTFVTTREKFIERYGLYQKYRNSDFPTFDSTQMTTDEILKEIESLVH